MERSGSFLWEGALKAELNLKGQTDRFSRSILGKDGFRAKKQSENTGLRGNAEFNVDEVQVYKMRKFWRLCSTVNIASTLGLYT